MGKSYISGIIPALPLLVLLIPSLHAQWLEDGVAICTAAFDQDCPQITADGAGGAIIAWHDYRSGSDYDIYARRIDTNGDVKWTADGLAICTVPLNQGSPKLASDGVGGAIIAWHDHRSGNGDIYAQRIDTSGSVQWTADGVAICTATGDRISLELTPDGAGGAIITWMDTRGAYYDVYAQRVDANGNIQWTADGVAICTATGGQIHPGITSDGAGGTIITWHDYRDGDWDIYAQRIDASGSVQWTADGVAVCPAAGCQCYTRITSDVIGGAIVTWRDYRSGNDDIYAQRIDASGSVQWTADGVAVCTATGDQVMQQLTPDDAGGAIITWQDKRSGNKDIYVSRVDADGQITATLLQSSSTSLKGNCITINWTLSEAGKDMQFFIFRSEGEDGVLEELSDPEIERDGLTFSFKDNSCEPGSTYRYRLEVSDEAGRRILFMTESISIQAIPLTLYRNHPNPLGPSTTIRYYLPEGKKVTLDIYDVRGRLVAHLVNNEQAKGPHALEWNGRNMNGSMVSSGVYFFLLEAWKEKISRKVILLR